MKFNKLPKLIATAIATAFIATGSGLSYPTMAAEVPAGVELAKDQTLIRGIGAEPGSLDPQKVEGTPGGYVVRDLFEGLVTEDPYGKIIPGQAESWTVSNDKKVYTFKIRDNANWSNGDPVTAHDFVFAFRRAVDPKLGSNYAWYMELMGIKNASEAINGKVKPFELGVKAIDAKTFEITLAKPLPFFIKTLAHYTTYPVHQKTVEKYGEKWTQPENMVTNGPYKLTKWVVNERMESVRNKHYWDDKKTVINNVAYLPIESSNAELNRYKADEMHLTHTIPEDHFRNLKKTIPDEIKVHGIVATYFYVFNTKKKPFDDVRVRKALTLAIDRNIVTDKILGMGQIPTFSLTPPYVDGFEAPENPYASMSQAERVKKAKLLLAEAGINENNPLKFEVLYNTLESHKKIALAAASMWKKNLKHVTVKLLNQEWKTFLETKKQGDFTVARYGWNGDYNEASTMLSILTTSSGANDGKYSNAKYDKLLSQSATAKNPNKFYQQAEAIIARDMPILPLYHYVSHVLLKQNVGGYANANPLDNIYSKNLYITKK
ncbi:peptide ABC transporter substrate-binding protein [Spartinivicinus poritis]|uniref:Peptide ABC transporter substrate-binding protein n=1 Tax=Spartinivicinus poritis TaxID=2994640 RepID=A0ABT5U827_9GAMM|nr:peptide ABC transporter substrate-binding protein [Spartinivicinus sp. A2-2]MDE1462467.1 peptide ABC transporter substrate-binding protein [Spartinivicinus sp. A2-2]